MTPEKKIKHSDLSLKEKETGLALNFKLFKEKDLKFLSAKSAADRRKVILNFNMSKLEQEYDYETDLDQLKTAREMLVQENISAIEFCVKEDPLLLVGNLNLTYHKFISSEN